MRKTNNPFHQENNESRDSVETLHIAGGRKEEGKKQNMIRKKEQKEQQPVEVGHQN